MSNGSRDVGPFEANNAQRLNVAVRQRKPIAVKVAVAAAGTATLLAAPATGKKNKLLQLVVSNTNASVAGSVAFKDGAGGTNEFTIGVPAGGTVVVPFAGLWTQTTAATLLQIAAAVGNYDVIVEYINDEA